MPEKLSGEQIQEIIDGLEVEEFNVEEVMLGIFVPDDGGPEQLHLLVVQSGGEVGVMLRFSNPDILFAVIAKLREIAKKIYPDWKESE